ncbi:MAG: hypothetical protein HY738_03710 [Bacteroidia bacterium]|nr:hypothetical protein [Bacteroidia bacterium]
MKNSIFLIALALILAGSLLLTSSCRKSRLNNKDTTTASDNTAVENLFDDIYQSVEETSQENTTKLLNEYTFGNCATVTVTPAWPDTTFPKTVTIDFGTSYCTGTDGRERKGKIVYTMTGRYRSQGTVITVTPQDFYIDDYKVEGTKTITNNGRNSNNNLSYTVTVSNAKITTPDNKEITWNSTRIREWIEGGNTQYVILDDVYSITGSASGVNREGRSFTVTITEALRIELDCRWIVKGKVEIVPDELKTRVVDYGDGTCDNDATVTIGDREFTIQLRS